MNVLDQLIPLADRHHQQDEYIAGTYWRGNGDGKGCAVGCTIHDAIKLGALPEDTDHGSHEDIAAATGIPEMCWRMADDIFEGLPAHKRRAWTPRFLRAAAQCKSPDRVPARIMTRLAERLAADAICDDVKAVASNVAGLWRRRANGDDPSESEWGAARQQANAAWQQANAAWQQAYAAWQQANAAREKFWVWCAAMVCEEMSR
jgi:hypothetical protein